MSDIIKPDAAIEAGQETIRVEARALDALAEALAGPLRAPFVEACSLLAGASGRVIVSGMGKSGLIGRKIAATLSSTGTPAQFVHPAEASHGDLGMITRDDTCIVISNSGETSELADLITHLGRFQIPMIAITRQPESTLARQADVLLKLPDAPEACPIGMTPTTSTTTTLVLGDALAIALMRERGFVRDDFLTFHPGGK